MVKKTMKNKTLSFPRNGDTDVTARSRPLGIIAALLIDSGENLFQQEQAVREQCSYYRNRISGQYISKKLIYAA